MNRMLERHYCCDSFDDIVHSVTSWWWKWLLISTSRMGEMYPRIKPSKRGYY